MGMIRYFTTHKQIGLFLAFGALIFYIFLLHWNQSQSSHSVNHAGERSLQQLNNDVVHQNTKEHLPVVLYNRIPKSASTSFTNLIYDLSKINEIYVLHINTSANSIKLSLADQISLAYNITHWDAVKPAFYHGHFCHYSFSQFGFDDPLYINILREPLDRLISHYYFLRYGDNFRVGLKRKFQGDSTTFDQCIEKGGRDCQPKQLWLQIPMLCGQTADCWKIGNPAALAQAKHNLMTKYTLVGLTERLDEFVEVLEFIVPRMFKGISEKYRTGAKSHMRKTIHKEPLSEKSIAHMKNSKIYKMEKELYDFASKHFDFLKQHLSNNNGETFESGKRFRYEKIYGPKGAVKGKVQ